MENATKALLIAAGVLIAILIISLGLIIYNKASETIKAGDTLDEVEMLKRTDRFYRYEGNNVSGDQVNAMLKEVWQYNIVQKDTTSTIKVFLGTEKIVSESNTSENPPRELERGRRYSIECYLGENTRRITKIDIGYPKS